MDYLNFDLRIGEGDRQPYPVSVINSPAGEASAALRLELDDPLFQQSLRKLELVRGTSRSGRNIGAVENDAARAVAQEGETKTAQLVGRVLFDALFAGEVRSIYRSSLAEARKEDKRLRVRLRVEDPAMAILPWEYLYDEAEGDHVSLLRQTPVSRYLEMGRPAQALTIQPPIRILAMVASPNDLPRLDAEQERKWMVEAIDHLIDSRRVELAWVEGQTWRDLNRALQAGEWHIFHFIGHGDFDLDRGEGQIVLADEKGGSNLLTATQLGRVFDARPSLRLAVLNACEGARASEHNLFSSTGAVLARRGIPAVVSMQFVISDRAAIEFSRAFYDGLARGLAVDESVQEARLAISMAFSGSVEWGTPVLHMRTPDGALFNVDLASAIFRPPEATSPSPATMQAEPAPQPARPGEAGGRAAAPVGETQRGLAILLRKVRQYWIGGVLEKSLYQAILIDLGMQRMQQAVDSPWAETPLTGQLVRPGAESETLAPDQKLADVFAEEGGSLLILGEPGSGKTTSMLALTRTLLDQAESDSLRPVPVILNLSSWAASYATLDDWLATQLSALYTIPRKIAQSWLAESRLLPLLDGLDELDGQRRAACVEAINRFTQDRLVGTVVCCRLQEYIDLPARLNLNAAVRLVAMSDEQVQGYLKAAGQRLAGLAGLLQRDSALRIEARSPLMLSLMSRAYQDLPTEQLLQEGGATTAARRKQLMEAYVARMFRRAAQGRGG